MHKDALGKLSDAKDLRAEAKRLDKINPTAAARLLAGAKKKEASAARQLTRAPRTSRGGNARVSGADAIVIEGGEPLV